jgi:hypothetical protein
LFFDVIEDVRDVVQPSRPRRTARDDELAIFVGVENLVVGADRRRLRLSDQCPFGLVRGRRAEGVAHVGGAEPHAGERCRVDLHPNGRLLAPRNGDLPHSAYLRDFLRQHRVCRVEDLR